jgi:hypothetical protein
MKTLIVALAATAVLAFSGVSQAGQISSPMIFGNVPQARAECVVVNGGTSPVSMTVAIVDELGAVKTSSTCGGPVAGGDFCALTMPIPFVGPFGCTATAGQTTNLRGALVLEDKVLDSFGLFQFRAIRSEPLQ